MVWYRSLGFSSNPLDVRPNSILIGLENEEEQLINHIKKGELCFLNGLTGSGKTSVLLKVQEFMKDHIFIYLDAQDLPRNFNLEEELKKKRNFFDKITLRKYPTKTPVLIIDEFQDTDKNLVLEARGKWERQRNRRIKSIVLAQISKILKNVTPSFKERLGSRMVTLPTLDDEEMKEIIKKRLNNPKLRINYASKLDDEAINLLVDCADGNPRRLLEYTDMVFDFHHRKFTKKNPIKKKDYKVTYWGVKEILDLNKVNVESYEYKHKPEKKRKTEMFERMFTQQQQKILKYLMTGTKTVDDVAKWFKLSRNAAAQKLRDLKKKNAIVTAGTQKRKRLWQIAPHVKRLTVKV